MNAELHNYDARVAMATTQFISTLDTLRNVRGEGQALDDINSATVPVATADAPLSAEDEAKQQIMERVIATFGVFEEQGIFAEITGPQKEWAKRLYAMLRTSVVLQG